MTVAPRTDQRTIEAGLTGREGIVGINIFPGGAFTPDRAIVQLPGGNSAGV